MTKRAKNAIGIAEGLLPLLDVSVLLLGFFIILLASGAFSQDSSPSPPKESALPGISQVVLLRVERENVLNISTGKDAVSAENVTVETLPSVLRGLRKDKGGKNQPIVLLYYENPWADLSASFDVKLTQAIREAEYRYTRVYP
jgi:biopolymer transport protein ExbD